MSCRLAVRHSPIHGLGVFATGDIDAGEILERSPLLKLKCDLLELGRIGLENHYYDGPSVGLGFTALYNDSNEPNAACFQYPDYLEIVATEGISEGQEITFNYREICHSE